MKYIIKESQLNNLIQSYITKIVNPPLTEKPHSFSFLNTFYVNSNGEHLFSVSTSEDEIELGVREDIWNSVQSMFSLSEFQTNLAFMRWMKNYNGTNFANTVYQIPKF